MTSAKSHLNHVSKGQVTAVTRRQVRDRKSNASTGARRPISRVRKCQATIQAHRAVPCHRPARTSARSHMNSVDKCQDDISVVPTRAMPHIISAASARATSTSVRYQPCHVDKCHVTYRPRRQVSGRSSSSMTDVTSQIDRYQVTHWPRWQMKSHRILEPRQNDAEAMPKSF